MERERLDAAVKIACEAIGITPDVVLGCYYVPSERLYLVHWAPGEAYAVKADKVEEDVKHE